MSTLAPVLLLALAAQPTPADVPARVVGVSDGDSASWPGN
jgi:hypothetical protein